MTITEMKESVCVSWQIYKICDNIHKDHQDGGKMKLFEEYFKPLKAFFQRNSFKDSRISSKILR